jgi:hypothetical protein
MKYAGLPPRLTRIELASLWKVTPERVTQLTTNGKLVRGSDGKYDTADVMAFRKHQLSKYEVNALFQSYGENKPPKVIEHVGAEDEVDPLDCTPSVPQAVSNPVTDALRKTSQLSELKAEEVRQRLRRIDRKMMQEEGLLIERASVQRTGLTIGTEIVNMLTTLEVELVEIFADEDTREDVRRKVKSVVLRCRSSIHDRLIDLLGQSDLDDPIEDEEDDI